MQRSRTFYAVQKKAQLYVGRDYRNRASTFFSGYGLPKTGLRATSEVGQTRQLNPLGKKKARHNGRAFVDSLRLLATTSQSQPAEPQSERSHAGRLGYC